MQLPGIKLNRGPVARPLNFGLAPEKFETIAQIATEIFNISYAKSVVGPQECLLDYYNCSFRG